MWKSLCTTLWRSCGKLVEKWTRWWALWKTCFLSTGFSTEFSTEKIELSTGYPQGLYLSVILSKCMVLLVKKIWTVLILCSVVDNLWITLWITCGFLVESVWKVLLLLVIIRVFKIECRRKESIFLIFQGNRALFLKKSFPQVLWKTLWKTCCKFYLHDFAGEKNCSEICSGEAGNPSFSCKGLVLNGKPEKVRKHLCFWSQSELEADRIGVCGGSWIQDRSIPRDRGILRSGSDRKPPQDRCFRSSGIDVQVFESVVIPMGSTFSILRDRGRDRLSGSQTPILSGFAIRWDRISGSSFKGRLCEA